VQKYYDYKYENIYRIILLEEDANRKPRCIWKADIHWDHLYNLVLFLKDNHYDVITNAGLYFFGPKKKYCFDCEMVYEKPIDHRNKCFGKIIFKYNLKKEN